MVAINVDGRIVGPTGAVVAGVEEVGGAVGVGEADAGRSFQEQEVGHSVP